MQPLFPPPETILLPIEGEAAGFPVRRVYCVGRNYADHAREMGHEPNRDPPFFFQKNPDNLLTAGRAFPYPSQTNDVHHEVEFVAVLAKGGSDIAPEDALSHVYGYAVGIDFTRRDMQAAAKAAGKPWSAAKAFEHSAPISPIIPAARLGHPSTARIWLEVNGKRRQDADIADMTWGMADIIAHASRLFTLAPGDVIFTGTPAGVGPVKRGDTITCGIDDLGTLTVSVV